MHKTFEDLVEAVPRTEDDLPGYAAACSTTTAHPEGQWDACLVTARVPVGGPRRQRGLRREAERQPGRRIPAPRRASACSSSLVTAPGGEHGSTSTGSRRDAVAVSTAVKEVLDRTGADAQSDLMRNGYCSGTIVTVAGGPVLDVAGADHRFGRRSGCLGVPAARPGGSGGDPARSRPGAGTGGDGPCSGRGRGARGRPRLDRGHARPGRPDRRRRPFDAIIHNAGVGYRERRLETEDGLEHVFRINVLGPYLLTAVVYARSG